MTEGKILVAEEEGVHLLKLTGDVRMTLSASLNSYIEAIFQKPEVNSVIIDLMEAEGIDSTALGLLTKLAIHCEKNYALKPTVFCSSDSIYRILEGMGLEDVFDIVLDSPEALHDLKELEKISADVEELRQQVLEAHRLLSLLNSKNRREFVDLIRSLEGMSGE